MNSRSLHPAPLRAIWFISALLYLALAGFSPALALEQAFLASATDACACCETQPESAVAEPAAAPSEECGTPFPLDSCCSTPEPTTEAAEPESGCCGTDADTCADCSHCHPPVSGTLTLPLLQPPHNSSLHEPQSLSTLFCISERLLSRLAESGIFRPPFHSLS